MAFRGRVALHEGIWGANGRRGQLRLVMNWPVRVVRVFSRKGLWIGCRLRNAGNSDANLTAGSLAALERTSMPRFRAGGLLPAARTGWLGRPQARSAAVRAAALGAAAACAAAAAGCAAAQPRAVLPRKGAGAASAAPAAQGLPGGPGGPQAARQQVIAAYQGSWQAYAQGWGSRSAARARAILAPYFAPQLAASTVRGFQRDWAAHEIGYGGAVTHVLSVAVHGRRALLHDCLDLSQFGAQNDRTGQVVAGSFGQPGMNTYVTLGRSGGRWRVRTLQPVQVPCAA